MRFVAKPVYKASDNQQNHSTSTATRLKMRIILFLLVATLCVYSATAIVCTENYCDTVRCAEVLCASNQRLVPNGSFCGCCDACITELDEGDNCALTHLRGVPPTVECRAPLTCIDDVCAQS